MDETVILFLEAYLSMKFRTKFYFNLIGQLQTLERPRFVSLCLVMTTTEDSVRERISALHPVHLDITDFSDGCGLKLNLLVVSDEFEGKTLLQRHRMVNSLLTEEMKGIHALTLTTLTSKQWSERQ